MTTPYFSGITIHESTNFRQCHTCRKPIGYRHKSYKYRRPLCDVCPKCHRKASKPGCEHRIKP